MKQVFKINDYKDKFYAIDAIKCLSYDKRWQVTIELETRKLSQNRAQWPLLNAIADQVQWPVNGKIETITAEEFKHILTAGWRNEAVRVAQGVDGGMVLLGHRTREFKASEWGDWMDYLNWFAADRGVKIPISKKEAESWGLNEQIRTNSY